ncbi:CrcB family protein [Neobacillus novalis]|uniref:Fluoride-specific ion channel FluC n=1 Tax=Neobacillus novalis TaxID=220687 RepID=A0AA95SJT2_9BACI|nr:CrcB family protein [Neobacillus novalis]WHY89006.1 CrcB family protein [Neobacillus novalis]
MKMVYVAVGFGGVIGAISRFLLDSLISHTVLPPSSGILIVNLLGCFIIGFFLALKHTRFSAIFRIGFVTGFVGSFTTFSSFSLKALELFMKWGIRTSLLYITLTIIGGFCFVHLGQSVAAKIEEG